MRLKILVASHKEVRVLNSEIYLPIQIGTSLSGKKFPFPYIQDNVGNNISKKRREYCELTGLYWAWKNLKDVDYVGLCQYRRYFYPVNSNINTFFKKSIRFIMHIGVGILPQRFSKESSFNNIDYLSFDKLNKKEEKINKKLISKMKKNDILLPTKIYLSKFSIFSQYAINHNINDFEIMINVIHDKYGYGKKYLEKIKKKRSFSLHNMVIMKKELLDEYCEWLFPLLREIESKISYEKRTLEQRRAIAFLAERMLSIWIDVNKKRFKIGRIKIAQILN